MLRVEKKLEEKDRVIFTLSGRIQNADLPYLNSLLEQENWSITLDLEELSLLDRETVRFLARWEKHGVELRNCPKYVREWILCEK